jgi:hypothetical protein
MTKVLSLSKKREETEEAKVEENTNPTPEQPPVEETFEEVLKRNAENKRRQEEDRKSANKGVIRSYRLKH